MLLLMCTRRWSACGTRRLCTLANSSSCAVRRSALHWPVTFGATKHRQVLGCKRGECTPPDQSWHNLDPGLALSRGSAWEGWEACGCRPGRDWGWLGGSAGCAVCRRESEVAELGLGLFTGGSVRCPPAARATLQALISISLDLESSRAAQCWALACSELVAQAGQELAPAGRKYLRFRH